MLTVFVLLRVCSLCAALIRLRKRPPGLPGTYAPGYFMAPLRGSGGGAWRRRRDGHV